MNIALGKLLPCIFLCVEAIRRTERPVRYGLEFFGPAAQAEEKREELVVARPKRGDAGSGNLCLRRKRWRFGAFRGLTFDMSGSWRPQAGSCPLDGRVRRRSHRDGAVAGLLWQLYQ